MLKQILLWLPRRARRFLLAPLTDELVAIRHEQAVLQEALSAVEVALVTLSLQREAPGEEP